MGTMFSIYVSKERSLKKPNFEFEYLESNDDWFGCVLPKDVFEVDDSFLEKMSLIYGKVVFMGFQSLVDSFQFVMANEGSITRKLVYGCFAQQNLWEVVEGEALEWEKEILQTDADLVICQESGFDQFIDARETCRSIAHYYQFPGW